MKIVGTALFWQNEHIETWLTVDNQPPVKLDRSNLHFGSAALLGGIFESEYNYTLSDLNEGCHIAKIQVFNLQTHWEGNVPDYYGTDKLDLSEGSVLFRIDTTNPTIGDMSIKNAIYFRNDLELTFITDEPLSWVAYCLDNQANTTIKTNSHYEHASDDTAIETIQVNANLTNLAEGSHSLVIYAMDTAGNTGVSQTITFTVIKFESFIITTVFLIVVAIIVAVLAFRRHSKMTSLVRQHAITD